MVRLGFLSGIGLIVALIASTLVGVAAFATDGAIFSPGPLSSQTVANPLGGIESHAEAACSACHTPFWGGEFMGERCLDCHQKIEQEMDSIETLHGELADVTNCRTCHTEHNGAQAHLTIYDPNLYPHAEFGFFLISHRTLDDGQPFECSDCHTDSLRTFDVGTCGGCHLEMDQPFLSAHLLDFGVECLDCHDGVDRYDAEFDHQATDFPLDGAHQDLSCRGCHDGAQTPEDLQATSTACLGCHQQDDVHDARLGADCAACHSSSNWDVGDFDHSLTGFPLIGSHQPVDCADCHISGLRESVAAECIGCHQQDDVHQGQLGKDCVACHNAVSWDQIIQDNFDHNLTSYPLTGQHASQATCEGCHRGGQLKGTPTQCIACHRADDAHNGQLGQACASCHSTAGWAQTTFDHSQTRFKLTGAHTSVECSTCHIDGINASISNACISCHRADDAHNGAYGGNCAACHSTGSWGGATFDHNQTDFPLTGQHRSATCQNCHADGVYAGKSTACISCHRADDAHNGAYGGNCAACHSTSGWGAADFDHSLTDFPLTGQHRNATCQNCHGDGVYAGKSTTCVSCHRADDAHNGAYGSNCAACHSTSGWGGASFDHSQTDFPLTGQHRNATCQNCHADGVYAGKSTTCVSCHRADDAHNGAFGSNCAACHTTSGWGGASFDHSQTDFPLTGQHRNATCQNCHGDGVYAGKSTACVSCHQSDDAHNGAFGTNCAACHSTSGWGGASFDHSQTGFALTGSHQNASCTSCHQNGQYQGTPTNCSGCHTDPSYHAGLFGLACGSCHSTQAWRPASYDRSHSFPLRHGNSSGTCSDCHTNQLPNYACTKCHDQNKMVDKHAEKNITDLSNCLQCHPNGKKD